MPRELTANDITYLQLHQADFIEIAFSEDLWDKEREIVESVQNHRLTTVRSCHGIGKSFSSARIALAYLYTHPNSKVITTAPTFRQVKEILWREIGAAKTKSRIVLSGDFNDTSIDISDQWFALGLSTNDPSRFQGFHAIDILLICDEAAGIPETIFNASEGIVSSENARTLYIGNPTGLEGSFYQSFRMPSFHKIHISAFDTPNFTAFGITLEDIRNGSWKEKIIGPLPRPYLITPEWVAGRFEAWGEASPMWQSRVMGEFPEQGEDTLIPLRLIELAVTREINPSENDPEVIGIDVARFGVDKTIFLYRKGGKAIEIKQFGHMDLMETANRASDYMKFHPNAAVNPDPIGVGAGFVDRLRQLNPTRTITDVNVGMPARNSEMFMNLRAEMYWGLRDRFYDGTIQIPDDEDLIAQLANIKYSYTPKGQIKIESKEDMKKRGLHSPDKADALSLAFCPASSTPTITEFMKLWAQP